MAGSRLVLTEVNESPVAMSIETAVVAVSLPVMSTALPERMGMAKPGAENPSTATPHNSSWRTIASLRCRDAAGNPAIMSGWPV